MLRVKAVSKSSGRGGGLQCVSLALEPGRLNILLGPTGSGKTTLMRLMAGLDRPDSGDIFMDGRSVLGVPVQQRQVAMVYQQFINYPGLTVYDNIASPLQIAGRRRGLSDRLFSDKSASPVVRLSKQQIKDKVMEAAMMLQLQDYLDRRPSTLSGGQQQRVALARALVKLSGGLARLVLLDEPLANLDYKLREDLRGRLPSLFAHRDAVLVYATTEPAEALSLGGHTACMHKGKVLQFGPTQDVYRHPTNLQSARVFSDPPLNTAPVRHSRESGNPEQNKAGAFVLDSRLRGNDGGDYTLAVRPHHLRLERGGADDIPISGRVSVVERTGSESFVHFIYKGMDWVALLPGMAEFEPDQEIRCYVRPADTMLFPMSQSATENEDEIGERYNGAD